MFTSDICYVTSPYVSCEIPSIFYGRVPKILLFDHAKRKGHEVSKDYMNILNDACRPKLYHELVSKYGVNLVSDAIIRNHLLVHDKMWEYHDITSASIEINSECNWRCRFCPNHTAPYMKKRMETSLFVDILKKLDTYKQIKTLSLNYYGEPLLDENIYKKLLWIWDTDLTLLFYTNGSLINDEFIKVISWFGSRAAIGLNLPSLDEDEFYALTGHRGLNKIISNLTTMLDNGIKVRVSVNGSEEQKQSNIAAIKKRFPAVGLVEFDTIDRAGAVTNEFYQNIHLNAKRLLGCYNVIKDLQIDIDGNVILCCQDFHKTNKIANINDYEGVDSLLKSENIMRYRKMIWGWEDVDSDFICNKCVLMENSNSFSKFLINKNPVK